MTLSQVLIKVIVMAVSLVATLDHHAGSVRRIVMSITGTLQKIFSDAQVSMQMKTH